MDELREKIPEYLAGGLSDAERAEIEQAVDGDPEFRKDFLELRRLRLGIAAFDLINEGHLSADQITDYVLAPDSIPADERSNIEAHIEQCAECAEELAITRKTSKTINRPWQRSEDTAGLLSRIRDFLFPAHFKFHPALAYFVAAVLAIGGYQIANWTQRLAPASAEVSLSYGVERAQSAPVDTVTIDNHHGIVTFNIQAPLRRNRHYSATLVSREGELLTLHGLRLRVDPATGFPHPIDMHVPASYLSPGRYTIRVADEKMPGTGQDVDTFDIPFQVIVDR